MSVKLSLGPFKAANLEYDSSDIEMVLIPMALCAYSRPSTYALWFRRN